MWEDATPKPVQDPVPPPKNAPKKPEKQGDFVLLVQVILCLLLFGFLYTAKFMGWPVYRQFRTDFNTAMQAPGPQIFSEDRNFLKFTQQACTDLWQSVQEVMGELKAPESATAETTRPVHAAGKAAPAGCSSECYLPEFSLVFPLPDGIGAGTSGYGWRTDPVGGKKQEFHTGADLSAAEGTPVMAAAAGVVRVAGTHSSYGNYIRILHRNGDETLYAHMQYLYVHAGQSVEQGQVIGASGQTGNVTGPHLHFELFHEGVRHDPSQALEEAL